MRIYLEHCCFLPSMLNAIVNPSEQFITSLEPCVRLMTLEFYWGLISKRYYQQKYVIRTVMLSTWANEYYHKT